MSAIETLAITLDVLLRSRSVLNACLHDTPADLNEMERAAVIRQRINEITELVSRIEGGRGAENQINLRQDQRLERQEA